MTGLLRFFRGRKLRGSQLFRGLRWAIDFAYEHLILLVDRGLFVGLEFVHHPIEVFQPFGSSIAVHLHLLQLKLRLLGYRRFQLRIEFDIAAQTRSSNQKLNARFDLPELELDLVTRRIDFVDPREPFGRLIKLRDCCLILPRMRCFKALQKIHEFRMVLAQIAEPLPRVPA